MWLPEPADVVRYHEELVELFATEGDPILPPGLKDANLLASACFRPHTSLGGVEKYRSLETKAAALFHSLAKNHAFHNGNKRTALATLLTCLSRNDRRLRGDIKDDDVFRMVVGVASDRWPTSSTAHSPDRVVADLSDWLKNRNVSRQIRPSAMRAGEFFQRCAQAGAKVKQSAGSFVISHESKSVRISASTRRLDGTVVRQYLKRLGLNENVVGFGVDEFQEGVEPGRDEINRYLGTMKCLAHA